jgi:hypothetical protein
VVAVRVHQRGPVLRSPLQPLGPGPGRWQLAVVR